MYDIAIIGAGPAGATLARLLAKDYKVLLLERRQLIKPVEGCFEKCCGGLIAPDAQQMLAKLGLGVPKEILVGPQLFTVRTIDIQNDIERYYQRHYINIDRERFDQWLVSLIPTAVDTRCGALFKGFSVEQDTVRVAFRHGGKEYTEKAKYLVGADGAFSTLRRRIAPGLSQKAYISLQEWFEADGNQPFFSAVFDNDISDFYSWTIPKEDLILVGTAVSPRGNAFEKFDLLKERLIKRGYRFGKSKKRKGAFILRPQSIKQICLGKGNIFLIGEAAGWISPTSAEGFSYAFRSAAALYKSIQKDPVNPVRQYYYNTRGLRMNIIQKNMKAPFMYNPFLRKTVMETGIMSMHIYQ
ncbi:MAG: FAD-binding protein [Clostridiales bacterium]|jgi:geranylgeranyl reductase|nr:FAD-binding protein [Clostridiales bacterium]